MGLGGWISDRWEEWEIAKERRIETIERIEKDLSQTRDFRRKVADDFYITDEGPPRSSPGRTLVSKRELLSLIDTKILQWERELENNGNAISYPRWWPVHSWGHFSPPWHSRSKSYAIIEKEGELTKDGKRLTSLMVKLYKQREAAEEAYRSAFRADLEKLDDRRGGFALPPIDGTFGQGLFLLRDRSVYWIWNEIKARADALQVEEQAAKKAAAAKAEDEARAAIRKEEEQRKERRKLAKRREKDRIHSQNVRYRKLLGPIPEKRMGDDKWILAELVKVEKKAEAHSKKLSKFFKDQNISDELQKMVKRKQDTSIDDVAHIHARGWVEESNMHPVINSILNKKGKGLTVDDGDYLFRYREHKALLEALAAGKKRMDWAKQLLESGFADNVKAMDMVVGGMSVAAARKAYGLGPGPDPVPVPIPDIDDDDFDSDDEDNELLL